MIKNFAYTTPTLGQIKIGETVKRGDKTLPQKADHFMVVSQVRIDGSWVPHPISDELSPPPTEGQVAKKLREIPVRLMYSDPRLVMTDAYEAFNDKGRQVCVGDGEFAMRRTGAGIEKVTCVGSDACEFGAANRCKPFGRLHVQIDGQTDPCAVFIHRTRGVNAVKAMRSVLERLHAELGDRLAGFPLKLVLRAKTSKISCWSAFFYAQLTLRGDTEEWYENAVKEANGRRQRLAELGINKVAAEAKMLELQSNGAFVEDADEDSAEFDDLLLVSDAGPQPPGDAGNDQDGYAGLRALRVAAGGGDAVAD